VAPVRVLAIEVARRLAISAQLLDAPKRPATRDGILDVVRHLTRLQLDPTRAVERSHLLVLWSRVGPYDRDLLRRLLEEERALFEYRAFIVPTDDYALYAAAMRRWPVGDSARHVKIRAWMKANAGLRRSLLGQLRRQGPSLLRDLGGNGLEAWRSTGWTNERDRAQMLEFLWAQGKVTVHSRRSGQRVWDLAERVLPTDTPTLTAREAQRLAVGRLLRARGLATPQELRWHFLGVHDARRALGEIGAERVEVEGVPGEWWVHPDDLPLVDRIEGGEWRGRTTLLSPFDTLVNDRERAETLWGFRFRLEIYVPAAKRQYGFFVLPILHGDRLVGRVDSETDRRERVYRVNAVHWEPGAPKEAKAALEPVFAELAEFVEADRVDYRPATSRRSRRT
jgi:uncharacterized protein YcaQ